MDKDKRSGYKRKVDNNEDTEPDTRGDKNKKEKGGTASKKRRYSSSYLSLGFTSVIKDSVEKPMCVLCSKVLASDSMRTAKLKQHLETLHPEYVKKPIDFFQKKLDETNTLKQKLEKKLSLTPNILLASYHASYRIAKCKKTHTLEENMFLSAATDMVRILFGKSCAKQMQKRSLSENTVRRRINDISEDIFDQLISRLRISKFAIQVVEVTDIAEDAYLIVYVRYVAEKNILEDILFCKPILGKTTSIVIFNLIDRFFKKNGIMWNNCVGLCTDGAHSVSRHKTGLKALVEKKAPHAIWTHCMLNVAALVSKNMSKELNIIFTKVVKMINYIKSSRLRGGLSEKLSANMEEIYPSILHNFEVRWLSHTKMIQCMFGLRVEIATLLEENQHEEAHLWKNNIFIVKLAYLVEVFGKLGSLNKSMQGSNMHPFVQKEKVTAFIKDLKLWKSNLEKNKLDMFLLLKDFWATANIEASKNIFLKHLDGLVVYFSNYFKYLDFSKFMWVQNPFNYNEEDEFKLRIIETKKLIELSSDSSLKQKFQNETMIQFWVNLSGKYELLYCKAMEVLLPFVSSYLCETGFSALAAMKTKYQIRSIVEKELRVVLSTLPPRFEKICANKQKHPSH